MNKIFNALRWTIGAGLLGSAIGIGLLGTATLSASGDGEYGDDDRYERHSESGRHGSGAFPANDVYTAECGACHLAYPPNLLSSESWQAILSDLGDHFGDNAELPDATREEVLAYLVENAADSGKSSRSRKWLRGVGNEPPLRITELPYFIDRHDEVPAKMVKDNPQVGSFSNCNACHANAERGQFDDDTVDIPGFGRWDD